MTNLLQNTRATSLDTAEGKPKLTICRWLGVWIATLLVLSGCAATPTSTLVPVGLYTLVGPIGAEHCEKSNKCVIRTETGQTYLSIGEQSMVMISFAGRGGDVKNYFDYLITIQNIGENDLFFDPNDIDGYDPDVLLEPIRKKVEDLETLSVLGGLLTVLGGNPNMASHEYLSTIASQEWDIAVSQFEKQKLVAQVIPPGEKAGGRIIVKSTGKLSEYIDVSIPIGSDFHTASFAKRGQIPKSKRQQSSNLANISGEFSFDGRWLVIDTNEHGYTNMFICNIHTEGDKIYEECDTGHSQSGTVEGIVATLLSSSNVEINLIAVDQNTLEYEYGIYERQ